jgi:hypothetical protein
MQQLTIGRAATNNVTIMANAGIMGDAAKKWERSKIIGKYRDMLN